jgi:NAD(P)-dependent dehydrogenase (short-subunit alcohol dehydrogenase family)
MPAKAVRNSIDIGVRMLRSWAIGKFRGHPCSERSSSSRVPRQGSGIAAERIAKGRGSSLSPATRGGQNALLRGCARSPRMSRTEPTDLLSVGETKQVGARIAAEEPRIDVLINNAGSIFASRAVTAEDLERTFALNHMAYFVLTQQLRERLIASTPARIVNTASRAHQGQFLNFQ